VRLEVIVELLVDLEGAKDAASRSLVAKVFYPEVFSPTNDWRIFIRIVLVLLWSMPTDNRAKVVRILNPVIVILGNVSKNFPVVDSSILSLMLIKDRDGRIDYKFFPTLFVLFVKELTHPLLIRFHPTTP
jgi:hypothetical protein